VTHRVGTKRDSPNFGVIVGVFPNPAALLRLAGSVLVEAHDEWQVADQRYLYETTLALLNISEHSNNEPIAVPAAITA
jgi:putative transposase